MRKYVFVDSANNIKGVCTADRELSADEVYPNMNYVAVEVEDENIIRNFERYKFDGVGTVVLNQPPLSEIQQQKILELNTACNNLILSGFVSSATGSEHKYKFDMEYQANFAQEGVMLSLDPTISTVMWPTSDAGVIPHSREQFIKLCQDAQTWKTTNTYRYFELKTQVVGCETVEAVNAIAWRLS